MHCKLWTILEHCYNPFTAYCFSYNISLIRLFRKENKTMSIKHAKFRSIYCHCWWQRFFLLMNSQFCCEIRQLRWKKFIKLIKDQIEFNFLWEKYMSLFKLRQVFLIPSFRIVTLLCCGGYFSNITIIKKSLSLGRFLAL